MILIDSSVWIDHFRSTSSNLVLMLSQGSILQHPFVTAEIALGSVKDPKTVTSLLNLLPQANHVEDAAILEFISDYGIASSGLGLVDTHLLATAVIGNRCKLWTRDKRLAAKAAEMNCAFQP